MKTALKIIPYFMLLLFVFCSREKNPVNSPVSKGESNFFSIYTDKSSYSWQQGEGTAEYTFIQISLKNESDSLFFSDIGDIYGSLLLITEGTDGYVEKYSESDNSWNEIERMYTLEGTRVIPIEPSIDYLIHCDLKKNDDNENGKYRIRIDYYDIENPDSTVVPYYDYSNIFYIE